MHGRRGGGGARAGHAFEMGRGGYDREIVVPAVVIGFAICVFMLAGDRANAEIAKESGRTDAIVFMVAFLGILNLVLLLFMASRAVGTPSIPCWLGAVAVLGLGVAGVVVTVRRVPGGGGGPPLV
jgi:hypothetical protein